MFTSADLQDFIVYDIETVSEYKSLDELQKQNPKKADLWVKRCEWLRKKFDENKDKTDEELYIEKAGLQAEFGKIICISIGKMNLSGDETRIDIKSYDDDDEKELLRKFTGNANAILNKLPGTVYIGFNSKRFDVPYITKRCFINKVNIPAVLRTYKVKPWESKCDDVIDIWSGGSWQESFTPLALVCECLDVPTPKDDIDGSEVGRVYWEENDLNRIVKYCEKDILSTANCLLRLGGKKLIENHNVKTK